MALLRINTILYSGIMNINSDLRSRYVRLQAYLALEMYNRAEVGVTLGRVVRAVTLSGVQKRSFFSTGIPRSGNPKDRVPLLCIPGANSLMLFSVLYYITLI